MTLALVLGTILALGTLGYVLAPLFLDVRPVAPARVVRAPRDLSVAALREIEFDRATGKLSQVDYDELRARYVAPALEEMRRAESDAATADAKTDDPIEIALRVFRATHRECPTCGPRPEPDAVYCSDCGRYLDGSCAGCGATVTAAGACFCPACGNRLAA
jgi:hypothetical protein